MKNLKALSFCSHCEGEDFQLLSQLNLETLNFTGADDLEDQYLLKLTSLTHLSLTDWGSLGRHESKLTNECLKQLTNLKYLELDLNKGGYPFSDDGMSHLVNLTELNITNPINISTKSLNNLTNLTILSLSKKSNFIRCELDLSELTQLTSLKLSGYINALNQCVGKLTNLHSLYVDSTGNCSDEELKNLTQLEELTLWSMENISSATIGTLSDLKSLTSSYVQIQDMDLAKLVKLTRLSIKKYSGDFKELSANSLKNLEYLDMQNDCEIPNEVFQSLTNLKELYLMKSF